MDKKKGGQNNLLFLWKYRNRSGRKSDAAVDLLRPFFGFGQLV